MSIMDPPTAPTSKAVVAFTDEDRARLAELETTISGNLEAFLRVGRALEEIRQERLYLLSHVSFAA